MPVIAECPHGRSGVRLGGHVLGAIAEFEREGFDSVSVRGWRGPGHTGRGLDDPGLPGSRPMPLRG